MKCLHHPAKEGGEPAVLRKGTNEWTCFAGDTSTPGMKEPPHIMIFVPGKLDQKVYTSDEHSGGPWIMWAGTPYEHLMVPIK